MSKKRILILLLALVPLMIGGAVVGTLANGSRSTELSSLPATPTPEPPPFTVAEEGSPPILGLSEHMLPLSESTHVESGVAHPRSKQLSSPAHSEEPTVERIFASEAPVESGEIVTGEIVTMAQAGEQSHRRFYTPWSTGHIIGGSVGLGSREGMSGSAGGGSSSSAGGSGDNTTQPHHSNDEHESLAPSADSTHESSDENSGSGPSEDLDRASTGHDDSASYEEDVTESYEEEQPKKEEPEGAGPKGEEPKGEEPKGEEQPKGEEPLGQDPTGTDPIYIPPQDTNPPVVQVPEPATLGLLGLGLLGCAVARRKKANSLRRVTR